MNHIMRKSGFILYRNRYSPELGIKDLDFTELCRISYLPRVSVWIDNVYPDQDQTAECSV